MIRGLEAVHFGSKSVKIDIIDGGINTGSVTLAVTSEKNDGLGMTVRFYGEKEVCSFFIIVLKKKMKNN